MAPDASSVIAHARQKWTALPPLVLSGVGTPLVESLPSYVARLLTTTGGTAVHLADGLGLQSTTRLRRIGSFLKVKDPFLAERNLDELERLTGASNLRCGTFWALGSILTAFNQDTERRSRRRWCPACYDEWGLHSY